MLKVKEDWKINSTTRSRLTMGLNAGPIPLLFPLAGVVWAGIAQSVWQLMRWTDRGWNPSGGKTFCTCPDWSCGPPSLLYSGYRVSSLGLKQPVRGINHPSPTSTKVEEKVELLCLWAVMACSRVNCTFHLLLVGVVFSSIWIHFWYHMLCMISLWNITCFYCMYPHKYTNNVFPNISQSVGLHLD
jgi:hypothetical protein